MKWFHINKAILTSKGFLTGLVTLLLNDLLLKKIYGNWITGKLSDFAGLFIFPLFWLVFFPKLKMTAYILTAVIFIFWKTNSSTAFIDFWNSLEIYSIGRVIDYSDFLAFGMLPLSYFYYIKQTESLALVRVAPTRIRAIITIAVALSSAVAFLATSRIYVIKYESTAAAHSYYFSISKSSLVNQIHEFVKRAKRDEVAGAWWEKVSAQQDETLQIIQLYLPSAACEFELKVRIEVSQSGEGSKIRLIDIRHLCPSKEGAKDDFLTIFEEAFVKQLGAEYTKK